MNPWNTYRSRINAHGITKRDSVLQRERAFLSAKLPLTASQSATLFCSESERF